MTYVQIQFTIDDPVKADGIVDELLAGHLVACGQRSGPVVSRYWWRGAIERADEWRVVLETRSELAQRVIGAIVASHPYETPEVVALPIGQGAPGYLEWIAEVTSTATQ